ncbi:SDR family oxidoreductase [Sphingomonas sp. GM_Shp_2]|uniref:SDR family oxidoreductase n=1 Tax=Sphingomonas sp. GM_Shp_2 TaxID=2937380 RepID=UPI00226AADF9|nr:SDR family oxidoreductase [Sphingomonas sp. GM_Shp_2]
MTNRLKNAVTIITGAASGIGAASARRLGTAGARLVLADLDQRQLDALVAEIRESGGEAIGRVTDVTDYAQVEALVAAGEEAFGPIDILVNNAGLMLFSYWKDRALADWDKMIDVNLRGYLHGIAAVLPGMLERKAGRILNMDSVAGHRAGEAGGVYSATKFFVQGMTESLRKEVGVSHGIQVGMVSPGVIDTGWPDKLRDGPAKDVAIELAKNAIKPEAVAEAVAFALNQPKGVAINEVIVAPVGQPW